MSILSAQNVSVIFNNGEATEVEAIRNISFELALGETLAIVGPSGCGKSTLFNVIAGLIQPTNGNIQVEGKNVDSAAGHVGYMLQKDLLLPWRSVLDNILLGIEVRGKVTKIDKDRVLDLIRRYGLKGFENAKPSQLSGGMRQRVAFMRFAEEMNGGYADPNVSQEIDRLFKLVGNLKELEENREFVRITAERQSSGGVLSAIFGDRAQALRELPDALKEDTVTKIIQQSIEE